MAKRRYYRSRKEWLEIGAGPLRVRGVPVKSYGQCTSCYQTEELYDGMCKFCRWMKNDNEANQMYNHKRGRDPLTFTV